MSIHLHKVDTFSILKFCEESDDVRVLQTGMYSDFPGHLNVSNILHFPMHNRVSPTGRSVSTTIEPSSSVKHPTIQNHQSY